MAKPPRRTDLKIVGGTNRPHRRKAKAKSPRLSRCPSPPVDLTKEAKAEWRKLAPRAHRLGTLTGSDLRAFELLCVTLAMEAAARQTIADEGMTVVGANGGIKTHPAAGVLAAARSASIRMLTDFGLTPRGRMSVDPAPADDKPGGFFDS